MSTIFHLIGSLVFLFLEDYGVRKLEAFFGVLIATMAVSFAVMFGETKPSFKGLLIGSYSASIFSFTGFVLW